MDADLACYTCDAKGGWDLGTERELRCPDCTDGRRDATPAEWDALRAERDCYREVLTKIGCRYTCPTCDMDPVEVSREAVERIAALRAERDRYREALEPFVAEVDEWPEYAPFIETFMEREDWERARAALDAKEGT